MRNADVRKIVDGFLKAPKTVAGLAAWRLDPDSEAWRWLTNIEINGELPGVSLVVKFYPRSETLKFSITLNFQRCFWRLDFAHTEHVNPVNAPTMGGMIIREPHYHPWSDNRTFATANSLPRRLQNARLLPLSIQTFQPAFRWFLDETNIYIDALDTPDLPKRDTLL